MLSKRQNLLMMTTVLKIQFVCITESGASPNVSCIFPFNYDGVIYTSCIWEDAQYTDYKPWCSTLVDKAGHHVTRQSKWGNCGPDCPISPDNRNETTKITGMYMIFKLACPLRAKRRNFLLVKGSSIL